MLFPVGAFDKTRALQTLASAAPWDSYDLHDVQVLLLNDGTTSVVYAVEARREGQPLYRAVMSSTYVLRQDTWKLALHTQTPTS